MRDVLEKLADATKIIIDFRTTSLLDSGTHQHVLNENASGNSRELAVPPLSLLVFDRRLDRVDVMVEPSCERLFVFGDRVVFYIELIIFVTLVINIFGFLAVSHR